MAELGDGAELQHPPGALDGVELALRLDQGLGVAGEAGQRPRQPLEAVARLLDEERNEVDELGVHRAAAPSRPSSGRLDLGPAVDVDVQAEDAGELAVVID